MSIAWVSVKQRLPKSRRDVLVWGCTYQAGVLIRTFFERSRFKKSSNSWGGDIEQKLNLLDLETRIVTHWADVTPP